MKAKYVITNSGDIIIFSPELSHADFEEFNPVRGGFIYFGVDVEGQPDCNCYGEAASLGLVSDTEADTKLAQKQLFGRTYYKIIKQFE
jgi:hypothetical protein